MVKLLSIGVDAVSSAVVFIPVMFVVQLVIFKHQTFQKKLLVLIFGFYLLAVFSAAGIPGVTTLTPDFEVNLIPIIDILNSPLSYLKNTILNIILFIPFGFLLPLIWENFRTVKKIILTGLLFSIAIELLQLFNYRLTDIDDLITNTAGTIIGYGAARFLCHNWQSAPVKKYEPFVVVFVSFIIIFLIQPPISGFIWDFILSSPFWESIR